jgi:hypothetical protein
MISIERLGHIPSPAMLSQSQRSRLQIADSVESEEADDDDAGNSIHNKAVHPIEFADDDVDENVVNTTEDESLFTTDADVDIISEKSNHKSLEPTTEPSLPEMTSTTTTTTNTPPRISSTETTRRTTNADSSLVIPTQDPRLSYDDSEWKPLIVNMKPPGRAQLEQRPASMIPHPAESEDDALLLNHQPAPEDDPDIYQIGLENHAEEPPAGYQVEEEGQKQTADLQSNVKHDRRVISTSAANENEKDVARGEAEASPDEATSPVTPTKFNFLQWFNSQLNNVKLAQTRQQEQQQQQQAAAAANNSTNAELPAGPISPTRFFTVKPTAVSYTGVQPILRPKPWEENSTDSPPPPPPAPPMGPLSVAGFIVSTMNRTAITDSAVVLPQSFHVQTSLSLAKEPLKLVESPRSQKSLPDNFQLAMMSSSSSASSSSSTRNPRELQLADRQTQVESLTDFFPRVRRPVARPQVSKAQQRDNSAGTRLPIEGLFSTLKPPQGAAGQETIISKHRSSSSSSHTNSPIYTFKLNQGQSVHDVLSQLLADLTIGESPSLVEVDGAAPSLTLAEQEQLENNDMKNKASNKKVDDDRLKPWAHMPFRPAILNALYHNTRNSTSTNTSTSTSTSTNVSTPAAITSVTSLNEDAGVTTSTEIATSGGPNIQQVVTNWPTEFTTAVAGK